MPNFLRFQPREPNLLPRHVGKVANTRADLRAATKRPAGTVAGRWGGGTPPAKLHRGTHLRTGSARKYCKILKPRLSVEQQKAAQHLRRGCCFFVFRLWHIFKYRRHLWNALNLIPTINDPSREKNVLFSTNLHFPLQERRHEPEWVNLPDNLSHFRHSSGHSAGHF